MDRVEVTKKIIANKGEHTQNCDTGAHGQGGLGNSRDGAMPPCQRQ